MQWLGLAFAKAHLLNYEGGITFCSTLVGLKNILTHTTAPVKFTIVSFSKTRQLKHRGSAPILQNKMNSKMMAEKCLPWFYVCYASELHLYVCVCAHVQQAVLKIICSFYSLSHPILNRHMVFLHPFALEDNEKRKLYGYFSVNIVCRSWMVGAHLVCNVFTCLPFVNTHRLNGWCCCYCCCCCLMHVQNLCGCWMKELKREMHSRETKSTYASTTANTTFSLFYHHHYHHRRCRHHHHCCFNYYYTMLYIFLLCNVRR